MQEPPAQVEDPGGPQDGPRVPVRRRDVVGEGEARVGALPGIDHGGVAHPSPVRALLPLPQHVERRGRVSPADIHLRAPELVDRAEHPDRHGVVVDREPLVHPPAEPQVQPRLRLRGEPRQVVGEPQVRDMVGEVLERPIRVLHLFIRVRQGGRRLLAQGDLRRRGVVLPVIHLEVLHHARGLEDPVRARLLPVLRRSPRRGTWSVNRYAARPRTS